VSNKKKDQSEKKDSFFEGVISYLKGVKSEWGKITWPERKQVFAETLVVIGVVFFFTTLVFIIDRSYMLIIKWLLQFIPTHR